MLEIMTDLHSEAKASTACTQDIPGNAITHI